MKIPFYRLLVTAFSLAFLGSPSGMSLAGMSLAGTALASSHQGDTRCPDHPQVTKGTILEMAKQSGKFNILLEAIEVAGLTEEFEKAGPFTVLAPTDDAFKRMSEQELNDLLRDVNYLRDLILLHVFDGAEKISNMIARSELTSREGETLFVYKNDSGTFINDSRVIMADIEATNGIVHVLDTVLFPWK